MKMRVIKIVAAWIIMMIIILIPKLMLYMTRPLSAYTLTPSAILGRLINWGWIRSDFDEKLNTYVIAFSVYSQMYAELFKSCLWMMTAGSARAFWLFTVRFLHTFQIRKKIMIF